jgi:hypothetical protein
VNVDGPVGRPPSAAAGLQIWPNPGNGQVHLILPEGLHDGATLRVADALGRIVLQRSIAAGRAQAVVGISALPPGLYSVQLLGEGSQTPLRSARYILTK